MQLVTKPCPLFLLSPDDRFRRRLGYAGRCGFRIIRHGLERLAEYILSQAKEPAILATGKQADLPLDPLIRAVHYPCCDGTCGLSFAAIADCFSDAFLIGRMDQLRKPHFSDGHPRAPEGLDEWSIHKRHPVIRVDYGHVK